MKKQIVRTVIFQASETKIDSNGDRRMYYRIHIPKDIAEAVGWKKRDRVEIRVVDKRLMIKRVR